jgi:uncharacterized protein (TIGR03437 family)
VASNATIARVVSAASLSPDAIAPGSQAALVAALAAGTSNLALTIADSAGATYAPAVGTISSGRVPFVVPAGCALGAAVLTLSNGSATAAQGGVLIDRLAPALYSVDGSGSGTALGSTVLVHADGSQATGDLTQPVDLGGPGDTLTVTLYATGVRNVDTSGAVTVFLGGQRLPVQNVGPEGNTEGLDVITFTIPQQLQGAGQLPLRVVAGGLSSNLVTLTVQ